MVYKNKQKDMELSCNCKRPVRPNPKKEKSEDNKRQEKK